MVRIIGVAELRRRFRSILDQMVEGNTPYVVTRGSRPEAALVHMRNSCAIEPCVNGMYWTALTTWGPVWQGRTQHLMRKRWRLMSPLRCRS